MWNSVIGFDKKLILFSLVDECFNVIYCLWQKHGVWIAAVAVSLWLKVGNMWHPSCQLISIFNLYAFYEGFQMASLYWQIFKFKNVLQAVLFSLLSHADTTQCYWVILQDERKSTVVLASTKLKLTPVSYNKSSPLVMSLVSIMANLLCFGCLAA